VGCGSLQLSIVWSFFTLLVKTVKVLLWLMLMLLLEAFVFVGGKRANFRCLLLVESNSKNTANTNIDFIIIFN
jgi:hypothetical protein